MGPLNPTRAPRVKNAHPREGQPHVTGCLAGSHHSLYPVKDSQESATGDSSNRIGFSPESAPKKVLLCLVGEGALSHQGFREEPRGRSLTLHTYFHPCLPPNTADEIDASPWSGCPQGGRRRLWGLQTLQEEAALNLPPHLGLFLNWPLSIALLCFQSVLVCVWQGVFSDCVGSRRKPRGWCCAAKDLC